MFRYTCIVKNDKEADNMKMIVKNAVKQIADVLNRLGEDFDMLLMEDVLPYPSDMTCSDSFEDERFV